MFLTQEEKKNVTTLNLIQCLKKIRLQVFLFTCATISELPSSISTMLLVAQKLIRIWFSGRIRFLFDGGMITSDFVRLYQDTDFFLDLLSFLGLYPYQQMLNSTVVYSYSLAAWIEWRDWLDHSGSNKPRIDIFGIIKFHRLWKRLFLFSICSIINNSIILGSMITFHYILCFFYCKKKLFKGHNRYLYSIFESRKSIWKEIVFDLI